MSLTQCDETDDEARLPGAHWWWEFLRSGSPFEGGRAGR
jgi:hypothetical protein